MTYTKTRANSEMPNSYVSVLDYGAIGDGTTDDTAAIQAAIDANNGKKLYIPSGTYKVSDQIILNNFTSIEGSGAGSTFIVQTGTNKAIFCVGISASDTDNIKIPGYSSLGGKYDHISPYVPAGISGISFLGTGVDALNANPYDGNSEQAAIVMGGGSYSIPVQTTCWGFSVSHCHFRSFKRAVVFACRVQGPTIVDNCHFVLNHIGVENYGYWDSGPISIRECEFTANAQDFKSLGGVAPFGTPADPTNTYEPTWRAGAFNFTDNYHGGSTKDGPGILNNYNYPNSTVVADNDLLPQMLIDGGAGPSNDQLTVKYTNCIFEQLPGLQVKLLIFNAQYSSNISLSMIDCEYGFGYEHYHLTDANPSNALITARCGLINIKGAKVSQFGDPNNRYTSFLDIYHNSQGDGAQDYTRYIGSMWEAEIIDGSATTNPTRDLLKLETARNTQALLSLETGEIYDDLRVHYAAKQGTNVPFVQGKEKTWTMAANSTLNLDVRHYNSTIVCADSGTYDIVLPTIGNNNFVGLFFNIINVSGGDVDIQTADSGKIYNTTVENATSVRYILTNTGGDVRWISQTSTL